MSNFFKILSSAFFILIHSALAADIAFVANSTKHSEWELGKHWFEIKTLDNKVYQSFLPVNELQEIEYLMKGEEIIIQNEQILFGHFGYSAFDLFIPRLHRTLVGEGISTIAYAHVHEGKEVHAMFDVVANPREKSLSFKIEDGKRYKLFFEDQRDLESWQSGQEIDIVYQESLYEKDPLLLLGIKKSEGKLYENVPLLLLGIKNLETNQEHLVKADAFYRWRPKEEVRYRIMNLYRWRSGATQYNHSRTHDDLKTDEGKHYYMGGIGPGKNGDKVMVLEHIGDQVEKFGLLVHYYKLLNLPTGEVYVQSITDPDFHSLFNREF